MTPSFPQWTTGFYVGDISLGRQTHSQKQQVGVALINHILETCVPNGYVDTQRKLKWKQAITIDMISLLKNHTWDLVPRSQGMKYNLSFIASREFTKIQHFCYKLLLPLPLFLQLSTFEPF